MSTIFDVILLGPTGVTGREVARYLARRAPQLGLTWAVAGRDRDRIDAVLGRVGATPDGIVLADVADAASIEALVERGRVVANLVVMMPAMASRCTAPAPVPASTSSTSPARSNGSAR